MERQLWGLREQLLATAELPDREARVRIKELAEEAADLRRSARGIIGTQQALERDKAELATQLGKALLVISALMIKGDLLNEDSSFTDAGKALQELCDAGLLEELRKHDIFSGFFDEEKTK